MSVPVVPNELHQVDFVRVRFQLEFQEECALDLVRFLGLRPLLGRVARQYFAAGGAEGLRRYKLLFEPEAVSDPVAVRKFQKPAPPFVVMLTPFTPATYDVGETFSLELLFLGTSIPLIGDFLEILVQLGRSGLIDGAGLFDVVEVCASGEDGVNQTVWRMGAPSKTVAPPLDTLGSWLERQWSEVGPLTLQFVTPTRLLSNGRLLRRPTFAQLFPFMLRRVTSMVYTHADCEPWVDLDLLFQATGEVDSGKRSFEWHDWKELGDHRSLRQIGGFTGNMSLSGDALIEISWVIALAGLFGIGKGAAFGAGRFRMVPGDSIN